LLIVISIAVWAGLFKGVIITPLSIVLVFLVVILAAASLVGIGLIVGGLSSTPVDDVIRSFIMLPMMFLSGGLFPINDLPRWLSVLTLFDPMTYFVDLSRKILLGTSQFSPLYSGTIVVVFTLAIMGIGFYVFNKMVV
jgi:ABC-2 type transport system permease protein